MCATPLPLLHSAKDELEAQIMHSTLNSSVDDAHFSEDSGSDICVRGNSRQMLGRLRELGRRHVAPVFRVPQGYQFYSKLTITQLGTHLGSPGRICKSTPKAVQEAFEVSNNKDPNRRIHQGYRRVFSIEKFVASKKII